MIQENICWIQPPKNIAVTDTKYANNQANIDSDDNDVKSAILHKNIDTKADGDMQTRPSSAILIQQAMMLVWVKNVYN